jgi:2-desacetyl-2-hydroxyethyl bacteriochlorophyllide A dehydrogenase
MRAAAFPAPELCEMVERETPAPAERQVLVRVEACGLCGTDAHIFRGQFPARFPLIAGHELAGVVAETGVDVSSLRPGDHVVVDPNIFCGACRNCRRGYAHLCTMLEAIGVGHDGGFATHCLVPAQQCHRVPDDMPFPVASMIEPIACCMHGMDRAQMRSGEVVLLIGAGTIGQILLQLAILQGAATVIVSEPMPEKREAALRLGASRVVDPRADDLEKAVADATEASGADVVIECVGGAETAQQALDLAGAGGRVVLFGVAPQSAEISLSPYEIYRKEISVTGSFINPFTHARAVALLSSGRLAVEGLISHRLPLAAVREGIELLESGSAMKIIIEPHAP